MKIILMILLLILSTSIVDATQYFYFDAESGSIGEELPHHQSSGVNFCGPECSGSGDRGTYQSTGGAPQGNQYFQWETVDNQTNAGTQVQDLDVFPVSLILGSTYYIAYYFRFDRIDEKDIWEVNVGQSADKGIEFRGTGIRLLISRGSWGHSNMPDHTYTIWGGDARTGYIYRQNASGYSQTHPIQLEYETWYSAVMAMKIANDSTGSFEAWINGEKVCDYTNIQTVSSGSPTILQIHMGGTIKQPAYDAPAHYRKFDALMFTDSWVDVQNGNYLSDPEVVGIISVPGNLTGTIQ